MQNAAIATISGGGRLQSKLNVFNSPLSHWGKIYQKLVVTIDTMTLYAKGYIIEYSISNGGCMKKLGFTLAEVLITLGIIGIVAALTLPAIVQKQQKQEASSRLKKLCRLFLRLFCLPKVITGRMQAGKWVK